MRVIPNPTRWEKESNTFLVSNAQLCRTKIFGNRERVPSRSVRNVDMPPLLTWGKFDICTDHAFLRWLLEITDSSGRFMRWRMRLAEFDIEILHKKGSLNTQADAISCLSTQGPTKEREEAEIPCLSVGDTYPETRKEEEVTEEPAFEDEAANSLDIIVAN
eukprot:IDg20874t1